MATARSILRKTLARCSYGKVLVRSKSSFAEALTKEEAHARSTMGTWKKLSLFVAVPAVGYLTWKSLIAAEHEHVDEDAYVPYPHLRIRNKPFPWGAGDTSLFHNPKFNPGPEGYQTQEAESVDNTDTASAVHPITRFIVEKLLPDRNMEDQLREEHLRRTQKRKEEFLERKERLLREPVPIQPMNVVAEMNIRSAERRTHSGLD